MELSVVIPTRDRAEILIGTLAQLDDAERLDAVEVIVVDDGSEDDTEARVAAFSERSTLDLRFLRQEPRGPAAARNRALETARGDVCLFLGDDCRPDRTLIARHAAFHRDRPAPEDALLGRVVWAEELAQSPFVQWLDDSGVQFEFGRIGGRENLPARFFYTANVSVKTSFLRSSDGFDEAFRHAAGEDVELGTRLERAGMRLAYDEGALVEHFHPVDLAGTLERMGRVGRATALLTERVPKWPSPRRPGLRHRAKATGLTALQLPGLRTDAVRRTTWTFLCHEAAREAYWGVAPPDEPLRIGRLLARLALRDPLASPGAGPGG